MGGLSREERNQRLEQLFEVASELTRQEQASFLARACAGQTTLQDELRQLLSADRLATGEVLHPADIAGDDASSRPRSSPERAFAPGMRIDHYEVIRKLGAGGMSAVYLARDTRNAGALVALKVPSHRGSLSAARLRCEAVATAQVSHNNIARLHDVGEHAGHPYLVLEYIEGRTLRAWLPRFTRLHLPRLGSRAATERTTRVVELLIPVVRALDYAHRRSVIHRDIKLENIMITSSGTIKILDLGIAKLLEDMSAPDATPRPAARMHALTRTGAMMGTMAYMAPEQWRMDVVDHRCDLWAVGVMLYELIIGRHPLAPLSLGSLVSVRDLSTPMPSALAACPELGELGRIIDRCLAKRRTARYGTADALLQALSRYLADRLAHDRMTPVRSPAGAAYSIRLQGFPGMSDIEATDALVEMFGVPWQRGYRLVTSAPVTIKTGLSVEATKRYIRALTRLGAEVVAIHESSGATRHYRGESSPLTMPRRDDSADLTLYQAAHRERSFEQFCRREQARSHGGCECSGYEQRVRVGDTRETTSGGWYATVCFAVVLPVAMALLDRLGSPGGGVLPIVEKPGYPWVLSSALLVWWLSMIAVRLVRAWKVCVRCDPCGYAIVHPDPLLRRQQQRVRIELLVQAGLILAGPLLAAYLCGAAFHH